MCRMRAQPEAGLVAPRYLPSTTREVQAVKVYNSRSQGTQVLSDSGVEGCIVGVVLVVTGVTSGWGSPQYSASGYRRQGPRDYKAKSCCLFTVLLIMIREIMTTESRCDCSRVDDIVVTTAKMRFLSKDF